MMGLESQGMLMAVDGVDGAPVFLIPEKGEPQKIKYIFLALSKVDDCRFIFIQT